MISIAKLLPKEGKFFDYLERLTDQAFTSVKLLKNYIDAADPAERLKAFHAISASKSIAKKISGDITRDLCITFITPFDREDIQAFASNLYKIPKTIEKVVEHLDLYPLGNISELSAQVAVILEEAEAMEELVKTLTTNGKMQRVVEKAELLDALEAKGDEVLRGLLSNLMKESIDARELFLRKDVYDLLERVIDRYRDAAGIAIRIVLKHS